MKIRTLLLALIIATTSSSVYAKNNAKKAVSTEAVSQNSEIAREPIQPEKIEADLKKMFAEADKFYNAAKKWEIIKCEPKTGFVCTKRECVARNIKTFVILNKEANTIKRCDDTKYCEEFPAVYNQTGVFYNIQSDGPVGTLVRVLGDSRYKEISTIGLDAYIANGECVNISEEESEALGKAENPEAAQNLKK